jgi:hypothetical protein
MGAAAGLALIAALGGCDFSVSIGNNAAADTSGAGDANRAPLRHFANRRDNARAPSLRDHYVDFSFDYPSHWSVTPQPVGAAQNYVRVAAPMIDGYEPFAFHVGAAWGAGDGARDQAEIEAAIPDLAERLGRNFQNYRLASTGPERVGGYDSQGWRFTGTAPGVRDQPPVQIYGRVDIILPPGATGGVMLITLATSRNREIGRVEEVGETGTLKALFDSFRLGTSGGASANK